MHHRADLHKVFTLKSDSSLQGPLNFGIAYRLRPTRRWSNTIIHVGGNIGVICLSCTTYFKRTIEQLLRKFRNTLLLCNVSSCIVSIKSDVGTRTHPNAASHGRITRLGVNEKEMWRIGIRSLTYFPNARGRPRDNHHIVLHNSTPPPRRITPSEVVGERDEHCKGKANHRDGEDCPPYSLL